jgi:hypothetical protein
MIARFCGVNTRRLIISWSSASHGGHRHRANRLATGLLPTCVQLYLSPTIGHSPLCISSIDAMQIATMGHIKQNHLHALYIVLCDHATGLVAKPTALNNLADVPLEPNAQFCIPIGHTFHKFLHVIIILAFGLAAARRRKR